MRANITNLLFCVSFFLSFCTNLQPIFLGKTIWNKECPKSCSWSWEVPSLAQVGKFHKMLIACPWRPLVGFILSVFGMAFGLTRLTRVQPNSNSISQMSLINCSKPQLRCLQCETRGKKGMTLFFCPHKIWTLCISHIHRANAMKQGFIMILMESISVVCTRPPHHISIYPIHPVPKGHPCAPRINRLNGHNGRLNEHNRRDCHYGTTRHEALSKIGPFSQIGAFQTHNWDKCTISILLQKCDTTKGSFFLLH